MEQGVTLIQLGNGVVVCQDRALQAGYQGCSCVPRGEDSKALANSLPIEENTEFWLEVAMPYNQPLTIMLTEPSLLFSVFLLDPSLLVKILSFFVGGGRD